jgi:hypothetical protein
MTDKVQKIREEVEKLKSQLLRGACSSQIAMETRCKEEAYNEVLAILDTMQEEPVSEGLEEATDNALNNVLNTHEIVNVRSCLEMFRLGAKWQKEKEYTCYEEAFEDGVKWKVENLWKPADGDDLPEIDREVIAILDNGRV